MEGLHVPAMVRTTRRLLHEAILRGAPKDEPLAAQFLAQASRLVDLGDAAATQDLGEDGAMAVVRALQVIVKLLVAVAMWHRRAGEGGEGL
jgi:hypothetical protein